MTYTQAPKWTPAEIEILRENYAHKSRKEMMALLPNRSEFSIGSKARDLKLKCKMRSKVPEPRSVWGEWDMLHLKSIYSTSTKQQISAAFPNRTWSAIEEKARLLRLRKTPEFLSQIRADCARKTAAAKKFAHQEEVGTKVVVVKPAPQSDSLARKAIAERTPLEQAWCGNV